MSAVRATRTERRSCSFLPAPSRLSTRGALRFLCHSAPSPTRFGGRRNGRSATVTMCSRETAAADRTPSSGAAVEGGSNEVRVDLRVACEPRHGFGVAFAECRRNGISAVFYGTVPTVAPWPTCPDTTTWPSSSTTTVRPAQTATIAAVQRYLTAQTGSLPFRGCHYARRRGDGQAIQFQPDHRGLPGHHGDGCPVRPVPHHRHHEHAASSSKATRSPFSGPSAGGGARSRASSCARRSPSARPAPSRERRSA